MSFENKMFKGVITALVTPFTKEDTLDIEAFKRLLQLQKDAFGLVIAGSTGEGVCLTPDEFKTLISISKEQTKNQLIIASSGSNCTNTALKLQEIAEDAGADAHLSVAPYYNKPNQQGLFKHFSTLAKQAKKPIILYNNPARCIIEIQPDTVKRLMLEHEMILGIKQADTSMDKLSLLLENKEKHRPDFCILSGEDDAFWPFLEKGADGIISMSSNIALFEMNTVYKNQVQEKAYAEKIAQKLLPLYKLLFSHANPLVIKTIMADLGLIENQFRSPLCPLVLSEQEVILSSFKEHAYLQLVKNLCP